MITSQDNPVPSQAFIAEFLSVLQANGCEGLFGIDTIAKDGDWSEMTIGTASVVVSRDGGDYDHNEYVSVAFAFSPYDRTFKVHGRCIKDHKHTKSTK